MATKGHSDKCISTKSPSIFAALVSHYNAKWDCQNGELDSNYSFYLLITALEKFRTE